MIAYDFPGVPARLNIWRVRLLSPFILVAMPVGWGLLAAAETFQNPIGMAGVVLLLAGFFSSCFLIPTGIQRIASGVTDGLDEMLMAARLKAQSEAYRWFSGWVIVMAVALQFGPQLAGKTLNDIEPALACFFLWVVAWSITLPAYFLARSLPRIEEDDCP